MEDEKSSRDGRWGWLYSNVNVLNYTLNDYNGKCVIIMYIILCIMSVQHHACFLTIRKHTVLDGEWLKKNKDEKRDREG